MARKTSSPFTLSSSQPSFSTNNYPRISSISYPRSPLKPFLVLYFKCLDEIFEEKLRKHLPLFFFGFVWQCGCGCFSHSFSCQNACQ